MIEKVITYADGVLTALGYFTKNNGLAELINDGEKVYPAKYCTGGSYDHVSDFAKRNGSTYWRLISPISTNESESTLVSNKRIVDVTIPLRLVVCVHKKQLPNDNEYTGDNLCRDLAKNLTANANTLKGTLLARKVEFNVTTWETQSAQVFAAEYVDAGQDQMSPKYVYAYIDFNVLISMNRSCLEDLCASVSECDVLLGSLTDDQLISCILGWYDFSDANVQAGVSAQQQTDLTTWLCGAAPSGIAYQRPVPTGQIISYRTGDDAYYFNNGSRQFVPPTYPAGYARLDNTDATPFFTLATNNAFGNTLRFTNDLGGTVTNGTDGSQANYLIDHLTGYGWYIQGQGSDTWDNHVDAAEALTLGAYSDFFLPNMNELTSVADSNATKVFQHLTGTTTTSQFWTSTRPTTGSSSPHIIDNDNGNITQTSRTNLRPANYCRVHYT